MITHHFNDDNDPTQGGRFKGHYGRLISEWTWDADTRVIQVECCSEGACEDLGKCDPDCPTDNELKNQLLEVALDLTRQIRGKELDE